MNNLFGYSKAFKLKVSQSELIKGIEQSFDPQIWRLGMRSFNIIKEEKNTIVVSDKGQIETKLILEIEEQEQRISIKKAVNHNLHLFIPLSISSIFILNSVDESPLTVLENVIFLLVLTIVFFLLTQGYGLVQFLRFVGKLKEKELIE